MQQVTKTRPRFLCVMVLALTLSGAILAGAEVPRLELVTDEPVTLNFTDKSLRSIFEAIGMVGQIEFVFDERVDLDRKVSVSLSDVSLLDALRFFARSNDVFLVVRDSNTVLIAPDTRQKRQEHMPQRIRTFQLVHADPRTVITVLRSLLQTRELAHDDRLNTITMKDTLGQLDIAEEVIDRMDRESAERHIRDADRQPLWVGTEVDQDPRSKGDPVPRLEVDMERPVTLDKGEKTVGQLYEDLSTAAGIQFVFKPRVDLTKLTTLTLTDVTARQALDAINQQFQNFSVVWGPRTVLIAPDTRGSRFAEEHTAIQFFYLSHADPQSVIKTLRSMLQARQVAEIPRLNAVVIKDTVAAVETARELVERMDRADTATAMP